MPRARAVLALAPAFVASDLVASAPAGAAPGWPPESLTALIVAAGWVVLRGRIAMALEFA